jgi:hypothetical protein
MIVAMAASVVLVVTTILILYETLRLTPNHLAELPLRPRARIIAVVLATFVGHTAAVWTYAVEYWVLARIHVPGLCHKPCYPAHSMS